jgi:hypothetical protein
MNLEPVLAVVLQGYRRRKALVDPLLTFGWFKDGYAVHVPAESGGALLALSDRAEVGRRRLRVFAAGVAAERMHAQQSSNQGPGQGQVPDDDRRGRLPDVPESPVETKGLSEAVIFVENGAKDLYRRR